jgi:hypothetical protein
LKNGLTREELADARHRQLADQRALTHDLTAAPTLEPGGTFDVPSFLACQPHKETLLLDEMPHEAYAPFRYDRPPGD